MINPIVGRDPGIARILIDCVDVCVAGRTVAIECVLIDDPCDRTFDFVVIQTAVVPEQCIDELNIITI